MPKQRHLVVVETHPIQYHAPVYRALNKDYGIQVTAIYGSDFSVRGYHDTEFNARFAWDTDLLAGYNSIFLSTISAGGAKNAKSVSSRGIYEALRSGAPDAVLLTGYSPRFHRKAFHSARRSRVPILFRGETSDEAKSRDPISSWARDRALGWLYRRCHKLLYIGRQSYNHFKRLGVDDARLVFSPYCVDVTPFQTEETDRCGLRSSLRTELALGPEDILVLFSGKLSERKGPDLLLSALMALSQRARQRYCLLYLGNGAMRESLKDMTHQASALNVCFAGFQNQQNLSKFYHAADLLALPSRTSETWGLVVNEALHHGVPVVVSTRVGCHPDLIVPGRTGEICEAESVQSLEAALVRALTLTGRAEVRDDCRRKVSAYSVAKAAEGIAAAFGA